MQMMDWKGGRGHGSKHQALGWELSDVDGVLTHKALNGIQWYWCFQGTPAMLGSFLMIISRLMFAPVPVLQTDD